MIRICVLHLRMLSILITLAFNLYDLPLQLFDTRLNIGYSRYHVLFLFHLFISAFLFLHHLFVVAEWRLFRFITVFCLQFATVLHYLSLLFYFIQLALNFESILSRYIVFLHQSKFLLSQNQYLLCYSLLQIYQGFRGIYLFNYGNA